MKKLFNLKTVCALLLSAIVVTASFTTFISYRAWSNPDDPTPIYTHSFIKDANYIIENDTGTIKAFDGSTGELSYSGTSAVITNTINALPVEGGLVKLKAGTFTLTNSISILRDNVSLVGCGPSTVLLGPIAGPYIHVGDGETALTGIVIQNLRIDGSSQTSGNGIFFEGTEYYHITHSLISKCTIHNVKGSGMYLEDIDYCTIENNRLEGNGIQGLTLRCSSDNLITKNTCKGNTVEGMFVYRADSNSIVENVAIENKETGIHLFDSESDLLSGNICHANEKDGIKLWYNSDHVLVNDNIINANFHYGINISSSDCNDNQIENNELIGNYIGAFSNSGTGTIVKFNMGYVTENRGTATISSSTSVAVDHGLAGTPNVVTVTLGTTGAGDYYVDTLTSTQFTVHVANSGTYTVYWYAEYQP